MTNKTLADDYLARARIRIKAIYTLRDEGGYADVVRECQELVELILKAVLRKMGVEPPHWHDVSSLLQANRSALPATLAPQLERIVALSKALRKERELAYYGDEDYLPSEEYSLQDAQHYIQECDWLLSLV
jgi:HEPN domain-containing protein